MVSAGRLLITALTAAFLGAHPAWAQTGPELITQGKAHYQQGEFQEALTALTGALPLLTDPKQQATAHILLGMAHLGLNAPEEADRSFTLAVTLDPKRKLTAAEYPPHVLKLYEQARARSLASIIVQTAPSDAEVFIDGELRGLSPVPVGDLLVGRHMLKVVKQGYKPEEREIEVFESGRAEFYLELTISDTVPPTISHQPVESAKEGASFRARAALQDNQGIAEASLWFRAPGAAEYESIAMTQVEKGVYEGVVAREKVTTAGLEYYLSTRDIGGNTVTEGSALSPFAVRVIELDKEPPTIFHTPVLTTSDASELVIQTRVLDNKKLTAVKVYYRKEGDKKWVEDRMRDPGDSGDYSAPIPPLFLKPGKLNYYIEATDETGNVQYSGREDAPHVARSLPVLPFKDGYIIERKKESDGDLTKDVTINVGTMQGYQKDQIFYVFNADERIVDPETKTVLAINQRLTGKIKLTIPGPATSEAKITKEFDSKFPVAQGNLIRFRPSPPTGVGGRSEKFRENIVTWTRNPEPEVEGYVILRAENRDGPYEEFKRADERDEVEAVDKGSRSVKLEDGKRYFYKVRAYNGEKTMSDFSEPGVVLAKGGPNPPTMAAAVSGLIRQVPLTWQRSSDPETTGYLVYRAQAEDGEYKEIARLKGADTSSFTDKPDAVRGAALDDGVTYWYKLVSYNDAGKLGNMTEPVSAASRQKPKPPANLQVVSSGVRSVALSWTLHPDSEIAAYRIYRHTTRDGEYKMIKEITDRTVTEYTDSDKKGVDLKDGAAYFYRMSALNKGGAESDLSPAATGQTFGPPAPPAGIQAASGLVKQSLVSWLPLTDPEIAGYAVYRGSSQEKLVQIKVIREPKTSQFKDTGGWNERLGDGVEYFYTVASINSVGVESPLPEAVKAVTKPVPSAPTGLTASLGLKGKVTLSWSPNPETDIAGYRVLRAEAQDGPYRSVTTVSAAAYVDEGLKNGASYFYRIAAEDKDNLVSQESLPAEGSTKPAPVKPEGLQVTAATTSATLSWNPNPEVDVVKYVVYSAGIFGKDKIGETAKTSFLAEKLKPDSSYTFVITAVDKEGLASEPGAPVQVRTLK